MTNHRHERKQSDTDRWVGPWEEAPQEVQAKQRATRGSKETEGNLSGWSSQLHGDEGHAHGYHSSEHH